MLPGALVSAVGWAAVVQRGLEIEGGPATDRLRLEALGLAIEPLTVPHAGRPAALRAPTRHLGLSLAGRCRPALGLDRGLPVLIADRTWATVDLGVEVVLIG